MKTRVQLKSVWRVVGQLFWKAKGNPDPLTSLDANDQPTDVVETIRSEQDTVRPPYRVLEAAHVPEYVTDSILSPERRPPIFAITCLRGTSRALLNPAKVAEAVGGSVEVVIFETEEATRALSNCLPKGFGVYGGAIRVWLPNINVKDPRPHRLWILNYKATEARIEAVCKEAVSLATGKEPDEDQVLGIVGHARIHSIIQEATVTSISGDRIELEVSGTPGLLSMADIKILELAMLLTKGLSLSVREVAPANGQLCQYSVQGLFPSGWDLIQEQYEVGDDVLGRVVVICDRYLLVELFPGACGRVDIKEISHDRFNNWVDDPRDHVKLKEVVVVRILSIDGACGRAELSLSQGHGHLPKQSMALIPGGPGFLDVDWEQDSRPEEEEIDAGELERKLHQEEVAALKRKITELRNKLQVSNKNMMVRDSRQPHGADLDPVVDEASLLRSIRIAYAIGYDEDRRQEVPLARMCIGSDFFKGVKNQGPANVQKIIDTCVKIASGSAASIPGLKVHPLRKSRGGSAGCHVRPSDGAKAWRCVLPNSAVSGMRIHWWSISREAGGMIEFACIGPHSNYSIPG